MDKKLVKIIIIFLVFIIGGLVAYFTVFKKKNDDTPFITEVPEESFSTCSEITDPEVCNNSEDINSGNIRCEYNTISNRCRDKPIPVTCQDPDFVKSKFNLGDNNYQKYYNWISDTGQPFGSGTYKIVENRAIRQMPNEIILDEGLNPTEYCEWDNYDIPFIKFNTGGQCNFQLRKSFYDAPDLLNLQNGRAGYKTCENNANGEQMFLINSDNSNCNSFLEVTNCGIIIPENECNDKFNCLYRNGSCEYKSGYDSVKHICGDLSTIMNNCYQHQTRDACPENSCLWNDLRSRCLPIDYPIDDNTADITNYYTFNNIDCAHQSVNNRIECYTRD